MMYPLCTEQLKEIYVAPFEDIVSYDNLHGMHDCLKREVG